MGEAKAPAARLFVIKLQDDEGASGYAVAQRIAFIPDARGIGSENMIHAIEELFRREKGKLEAVPLPATDDPDGPGVLMFALGQPKDD